MYQRGWFFSFQIPFTNMKEMLDALEACVQGREWIQGKLGSMNSAVKGRMNRIGKRRLSYQPPSRITNWVVVIVKAVEVFASSRIFFLLLLSVNEVLYLGAEYYRGKVYLQPEVRTCYVRRSLQARSLAWLMRSLRVFHTLDVLPNYVCLEDGPIFDLVMILMQDDISWEVLRRLLMDRPLVRV